MDSNQLPDDDTLFLRAAQRESLLAPEQIEEARELQDKMQEMGLIPKPIGEILRERGCLTRDQAEELNETVGKVKQQFRIPGFKLLKRLGRGSMGTVYKARQLNLDRLVAIKVLASFLSENEAFVKRFLKEARVTGQLNHPSIVQGFDAGEHEGTYYFAMEYCPGPTLLTLLQRGGALDQDRAINIAMQMASGLQHAHARGLVHRDVKPDNIMIAQGGVAKLCDLGLAKDVSRGSGSTEKGATLGTPNYISPEQARGDEHVDIRSDIYSLGATLYHMVAGVPPFDGPNPTVIMVKHINDPPLPPRSRNREVDAALQPIIIKMMAKNPNDRYQTPAGLLRDLESLSARRASPHGSDAGPRTRRRRTRRRR